MRSEGEMNLIWSYNKAIIQEIIGVVLNASKEAKISLTIPLHNALKNATI